MTERLTTYTNGSLVFDVRDEGPLDGDPVVLLHGFPQRASSWDAVVPRLHAAGLRTLAPDQRGYSPGARPRRRTAYRLSALVGDVVALIDTLGRPVHLVGHDWGALVGWSLAAGRPDLVRSLTAVSMPHPAAFGEACVRGPQLLSAWYMGLFQLPVLPELLGRTGVLERGLRASGMTRTDAERVRADVLDQGALSGGLGWYRALPVSLLTSSPRSLLAPVRVPTTYVWSDGDTALTRAGAERCGRHVRGRYELVVLEGVDHWVPEHAPEALSRAILARIASWT